jgi:hypothetical protein
MSPKVRQAFPERREGNVTTRRRRDRGLFGLQKCDIGKLQDRSFSTAPDHKHEPLSVWRKCEILRAIYQVALLVFRHDRESNEWRIVFELIKDIDRAAAMSEWRS